MSETTNYARRILTETVVFGNESHDWWHELPEITTWAFYRLPNGVKPSEFRGRLIGESAQQRCARQQHRPALDSCETCRGRRLHPHASPTYRNPGGKRA